MMEYKNRSCTERVSKVHPNAYTKDELVTLAVKKLKYKESDAKRKTKQEICEELLKKPSSKKNISKSCSPPTVSIVIVKKKPVKKIKKSSPPTVSIVVVKKKPVKKPTQKVSSVPKKTIPNIKLHPYQIKIAEYLKNHKGVVAAFSTGSGKTLTAIHAAYTILERKKGISSYKILVISPATTIDNFKEEMKVYGIDPNDDRFIFMTKEKFGKDYKNGLISCYNKMLIIDEAHNFRTLINTTKVNRSKSAIGCSQIADKILLLTATPVYNEPYDAVNLAAMVKGENPIPKGKFEDYFNNDKQKLENYFKCIFSFYDIQKDKNYPTVKEHVINIYMTPEYQKQYNKIERKQVNLSGEPIVNGDIYDPLAFLIGMRQATNSLAPLKTIWVISKLKKEPTKKTVIYSAFLERGVDILKESLKENKIKFFEITGDTDIKSRQNVIDSFNKIENPNVLLITKTGGEGIDLKGVQNIIILEAGYHRAGEEQIIGRGVRYNSHSHLPLSQRHVDIYHLVLKKLNPDPNTNRAPRRLSADEILKLLIEKKTSANKDMEKILRNVSIEKQKC